MKVEFKKESNERFGIVFSDMSGDELDAVRIVLKDSAKYGKRIAESSLDEQLDLSKLIEVAMN